MRQQYTGYELADFLDDLRYRKPPKKRASKSPLVKYGRYRRIQRLLADYELTGNLESALLATRLRKRIAQPYRVMVSVEGKQTEFSLSARIEISEIEKLVTAFNACKTEQQVETVYEEFMKYRHYGN